MRKAAVDFAKLVPSVRWLEPAEALRRQPLLRPEAVRGRRDLRAEAEDMDVAAIHAGFLKGARAAGAVLRLDAEVTALDRADGRWTIRLRDGETVAATNLVNAAGAWADVVAGLAGAKPVGLVPKRRTAFTFDAPAGARRSRSLPAVIDFDESWYIKPEVGQFLGSPADETPSPPCDAQPEEIDIAIAVDRIQTATTLQIARIKNKWAGLRSFVADKNLVVGYDPAVEGFFWLAGQGGYGIQTGAAAGRLAASLALGKGLPDDIAGLGVTEKRAVARPLHAGVIGESRCLPGPRLPVCAMSGHLCCRGNRSCHGQVHSRRRFGRRLVRGWRDGDGAGRGNGEMQRRQLLQGHELVQDVAVSCKGKNSCKGLGWTTTSSEQECTAKGGKVL